MGLGNFFRKIWPFADAVTESSIKDVVPIIAKIDAAKDTLKIIFNEDFAKDLKKWPEDRLNAWLVRLGKAFGPVGLTHFSELSPEEQQALLDRVPILKTNHTDWIDPWKWVPRRWVCWIGGTPPTRQHIIIGNVSDASILPNGELRPIPANGEWYVIDGYMAATTADGIHDRLGWRWDDQDRYWDLSMALKRAN